MGYVLGRFSMDTAERDCFRYCPGCGCEGFARQDVKKFTCNKCGFEFYLNPAATAVALIRDKRGRLLVAVRKNEPAKGTLDLPGGFVDPEESAEEGLRREIREETGLEIVSARYLYSVPNVYEFKGVVYPTTDLVYVCEVEDASKARAGDDADTVLLMSRDELDPAKFGLRSIREIVLRYLSETDGGG